MATINPLFEGMAFGPEILQAMGKAFELACDQLHDSGQPDLVKEVLAKRIIELAKRGEIDPVELCKGALMALGKEKFGRAQRRTP